MLAPFFPFSFTVHCVVRLDTRVTGSGESVIDYMVDLSTWFPGAQNVCRIQSVVELMKHESDPITSFQRHQSGLGRTIVERAATVRAIGSLAFGSPTRATIANGH